MAKKQSNPNAINALNQMKLEIAQELGISSNHVDGASNSAYENGITGGRVGGQMSKRLVEMGKEELTKMYNKK